MPDQDHDTQTADTSMPTVRIPIDVLMALISGADNAVTHFCSLGDISVTVDRWARAVTAANLAIRAQVHS